MLCGRLIIAEDKQRQRCEKDSEVSNFTTGNPLKLKSEHLNEDYFDTFTLTMLISTSLADFSPFLKKVGNDTNKNPN